MRQYLGFRAVQVRRPQGLSTNSFNIVQTDQYEEVIIVSAFNHTSGPATEYGLANGTTFGDRQIFCQWDEGAAAANYPTSVEGTACSEFVSGSQLRVAYLDCRLSTAVVSEKGQGAPAGRCASFALCFLPNTYDETDPEDNAWSNAIPGDAQSQVGEVVRID